MRKKIPKTLILLIILISIYLVFIFSSDITKISDSLMKIKSSHLLIAIMLFVSGNLIRTIRWHIFLNIFNNTIPFKKNFQYCLAGFAFVISPGRLGEIVRSPYIKRDYGISISKTTSVVLVERLCDILGLTIVLSIGLSLVEFNKIILLIPFSILILLILIFKNKNNFLKLMKIMSKIKLLKNLDSNIEEIYDSVPKLLKTKFILIGSTISTITFLLFSVAVYFLISGLGSSLSFSEIMVIIPTSLFIATISLIPAGIGVFEGGMIGLFTAYGVQYEIAIATMLLIRLIGTGLISVIGLYFLKVISKIKN